MFLQAIAKNVKEQQYFAHHVRRVNYSIKMFVIQHVRTEHTLIRQLLVLIAKRVAVLAPILIHALLAIHHFLTK
jgi:hexokinase